MVNNKTKGYRWMEPVYLAGTGIVLQPAPAITDKSISDTTFQSIEDAVNAVLSEQYGYTGKDAKGWTLQEVVTVSLKNPFRQYGREDHPLYGLSEIGKGFFD